MSVRSKILSAKIPTLEVEVPEWDVTIRVRGLSNRMRIELLDLVYANEADHSAWKEDQAKPVNERKGLPRVDLLDQSILTLLMAIVDDKTQPIFTMADYSAFNDLSFSTLSHIYASFMRVERRQTVEDQKKSSD